PVGVLDGERQRLVQQQVTAGGGGPDRDIGLHVRRQRDSDRLTLFDQRVDLGVGGNSVPLGQRGRPLRVTAPHAYQFRVRVCVQRLTVRLDRPVTGAEQTEPQHVYLRCLPAPWR